VDFTSRQTEADLENSILTLIIPKAEETKPNAIKIKAKEKK